MKSIGAMFEPGSARPVLLALFLAWCVAGCQSPKGTPSSHLAAVLIKDRSLTDVKAVTQAVFADHGYQRVPGKSGETAFEKEGTKTNTLVYGDWSTKKIWVRVKIFLDDLKPEAQVRLACDVFMVGEHGDPRFEEEHKLTSVHRGRYQDLLNEVSRRLK